MSFHVPARIEPPPPGQTGFLEEPVLDRLLTIREVSILTSLSRATVYRKVRDGSFPRPFPVSAGRVAWSALAVREWRMNCAHTQSSKAHLRGAAA